MKKTKANTEHRRRGVMDDDKQEFTLATVDALLARLINIDPLCENTGKEYDSVRSILFKVLDNEVPVRALLSASKHKQILGF